MKIIFNGQCLEETDPRAQVSVLGEATQFGYSVFETFRVERGQRPGALAQHWSRLFQSAQIIKLKLPPGLTQQALEHGLQTLLSQLDLRQTYRCKVLASADFWYIAARPLAPLPAVVYLQGVEIDDVQEVRAFAQAKASSPLYPYYFARQQESGMFETLFFSPEDDLLEGNISNVIAVLDGTLVSPDGPVLPGVTVREVFKRATDLGIENEFRSISRAELQTATEIFLTNSIKGLVPVQKWNQWERQGSEMFEHLSPV